MKRIAWLIVSVGILASVAQATEDIWLLPTKQGTQSQFIKGQWKPNLNVTGEKATCDMWIRYDMATADPPARLTGQADVESVGCWFQAPARCSVLAFAYWMTAVQDSNQDSVSLFGAVCPGTFDPSDCGEYHAASEPCPVTPIGTIIAGPQPYFASHTAMPCCTLNLTTPVDVEKNMFFGGYSKAVPDSSPNPGVTGNFELNMKPQHSLLWRSTPSGGGPAGWYTNNHLHWVIAQVRIYENPPPIVWKMDRLPDSYNTGPRIVTDSISDFGNPLDSAGVILAYIAWYKKPDATFTDTVPMVRVSGDSTAGIWQGVIPGANVGDTIVYTTVAVDYQGLVAVVTPPEPYIIRAGTPGNALVLIGGGDYYGSPYSPDPWSHITAQCGGVDYWDEGKYGVADSAVLNFYGNEGPGRNAIFVHTFGAGSIKRDSTFFMSFLNAGGKLAITSQDLPGDWVGNYDTLTFGPGSFVYDYLKIHQVHDDYHGGGLDSAFGQYGIDGDPISGASNLADFLVAPYIWVPTLGYNYAGIFIELDPQCVPCFVDPDGKTQGYHYEDATAGYKLVNLYWPFQYIWTSGSRSPDSVIYNVEAQDSLAARICAWLTGAEETPIMPVNYLLSEAKPNPGQTTRITYGVPRAGKVSLKIYDISGSLVRTLVNTEVKPGTYSTTWDGKDNYGKSVATGIYYYKMETRDFNKTRKFVLVK